MVPANRTTVSIGRQNTEASFSTQAIRMRGAPLGPIGMSRW